MKRPQAFPYFFEPTAAKAERALGFYQRPIPVTREFRDSIIKEFPGLAEVDATHEEFCWRVMQHILFSSYWDNLLDDEQKSGSRNLVLTHPMIAHMMGRNAYDGRFTSGPLLTYFSEHVCELDETDWNKKEGRARVIRPKIDDDILTLAANELHKATPTDKVFFHNGKIANAVNKKVFAQQRQDELSKTTEGVRSDHPALELLKYLNRVPQGALNKIVRSNWPLLLKASDVLRTSNNYSKEQIAYWQRILIQIETDLNIFYGAVEDSPRLYSLDLNINGLPRALRKIAFAGAVEADLRSCHLAIVASKWNLPDVKAALLSHTEGKSQSDIWHEMLSVVGLHDEVERCKPIIKETLYSIIFGMRRETVKMQLAEGSRVMHKHKTPTGGTYRTMGRQKNEGIGYEHADKLLKHPYIKALFKARSEQKRLLKQQGYLLDAFGQKQCTRSGVSPLSVLAYVAQSYELKIMLTIFDEVRNDKQIHILSWLHDGVTLHFGNETKRERQIKAIVKKVNSVCQTEDIPTALEVTRLPKPTNYEDEVEVEKWVRGQLFKK